MLGSIVRFLICLLYNHIVTLSCTVGQYYTIKCQLRHEIKNACLQCNTKLSPVIAPNQQVVVLGFAKVSAGIWSQWPSCGSGNVRARWVMASRHHRSCPEWTQRDMEPNVYSGSGFGQNVTLVVVTAQGLQYDYWYICTYVESRGFDGCLWTPGWNGQSPGFTHRKVISIYSGGDAIASSRWWSQLSGKEPRLRALVTLASGCSLRVGEAFCRRFEPLKSSSTCRAREFHIYIPLQANRCAKTRCQKAVGGVKKCS